MSFHDSSAQTPASPSDQLGSVSWEDRRFTVHVNDTSFDLGGLPLFPWNEHSELVIRIDPAFDSLHSSRPHMVDLKNSDLYMRTLVQRAQRAADNLKELLQGRINNGECQVQLVFGEFAEILAAWHWIEPESVHQSAIHTRMLWPRVKLPKVTVRLGRAWLQKLSDQQNTTPDALNVKAAIWEDCHRILQTAYSTAQVPPLFPLAAETWDCFRLNLLGTTYVVQDLGDLSAKNTSVVPADDPDIRFSDEIIWSGVVESRDPDEDDYLYMSRAPTGGAGHSHNRSLESAGGPAN
ncbi:hypothetical protein A1O3_05563 [Capronia epimyces CBS 606.96]|uniref:Uncharacterized protein n=1 Tax=Capronia epimyces CBS 606.96 TaxID=1182542 RepID=W9XXE7_9EURO|nr:uncharacterized protein A1O3_05563 [Capronia epimyces CBS 606.96]EXJ84888.1 hypothetical protein A1O3_05563 [Capronia epimyces CBS 606.96]